MSEMISYWQQEIENYLLTRMDEIPNISKRLKPDFITCILI